MRAFDVNIVLVRTIYETNIGASARAMANMGGQRLILIDPKAEITIKAHQAAANGQRPLENRQVYSSWQEFYSNESEGLRISFTARDGKGRLVEDFATSLNYLKEHHPLLKSDSNDILQVYLIFGPEDWGLSAEDLDNTHYACSIPTFGETTSLNLAQAVLLGLFILRSCWGGERAKLEGQRASKYVRSEKPFPDFALKNWIQEMGFVIDNRQMNAYSVLKRMFLHSIPNAKELGILEVVLNQGVRKLREYNKLRSQLGLPHIETNATEE